MKVMRIAALVITVLLVMNNSVLASGHGHNKEKKVGILLVAFGSSEKSAQVSFHNIERKVKETWPKIPVRWAFTSHIIRHKLAKQGNVLDSPEMALARMLDEGFTHVAVQSLHTIGGKEYHHLRQSVGAFKRLKGFKRVMLGYPLMSTQKDMERVVDAIIANVPKQRKSNEAVVLMGHGTHHPSNAFYAALNFQIQLKDPKIFIGTVEGYPDLDLIKSLLLKNQIQKVFLMPFMSVAGDHAKNDMAGSEDDSWKSVLTQSGISCVTILKGTAEYDNYVSIWVDHLKKVLAHF